MTKRLAVATTIIVMVLTFVMGRALAAALRPNLIGDVVRRGPRKGAFAGWQDLQSHVVHDYCNLDEYEREKVESDPEEYSWFRVVDNLLQVGYYVNSVPHSWYQARGVDLGRVIVPVIATENLTPDRAAALRTALRIWNAIVPWRFELWGGLHIRFDQQTAPVWREIYYGYEDDPDRMLRKMSEWLPQITDCVSGAPHGLGCPPYRFYESVRLDDGETVYLAPPVFVFYREDVDRIQDLGLREYVPILDAWGVTLPNTFAMVFLNNLGDVDTETILHEFGHVMGLNHAFSDPADSEIYHAPEEDLLAEGFSVMSYDGIAFPTLQDIEQFQKGYCEYMDWYPGHVRLKKDASLWAERYRPWFWVDTWGNWVNGTGPYDYTVALLYFTPWFPFDVSFCRYDARSGDEVGCKHWPWGNRPPMERHAYQKPGRDVFPPRYISPWVASYLSLKDAIYDDSDPLQLNLFPVTPTEVSGFTITDSRGRKLAGFWTFGRVPEEDQEALCRAMNGTRYTEWYDDDLYRAAWAWTWYGVDEVKNYYSKQAHREVLFLCLFPGRSWDEVKDRALAVWRHYARYGEVGSDNGSDNSGSGSDNSGSGSDNSGGSSGNMGDDPFTSACKSFHSFIPWALATDPLGGADDNLVSFVLCANATLDDVPSLRPRSVMASRPLDHVRVVLTVTSPELPRRFAGRVLHRLVVACRNDSGWCTDLLDLGTVRVDENGYVNGRVYVVFPLVPEPANLEALAGTSWTIYFALAPDDGHGSWNLEDLLVGVVGLNL
ncbi:hypothetical protein [Thermosulfurimonas sp. F29]|uniref:hypothetical protein n=1 Tax=Thermosulfurimonas sp. F29 TaxID=2867247 RepID=UPI001C83A573|nr:hypothetical protein [Thermosulfurimonas sp. F29]MBX6423417.1 hypothetical protein [Thermosulfurimonas sp. F29]